ncbi:MAG: DUF721 domain-containing protein [Solitalea-like symbiont of Acarus siro]
MAGIKTRYKSTNHIKNILFGDQKSFFSLPYIQNNCIRSKLISSWHILMGEAINKYTSYLNVHNNTLFISFSNSVLTTEINLSKTKTIKKINLFLGHNFINEISIVTARKQ